MTPKLGYEVEINSPSMKQDRKWKETELELPHGGREGGEWVSRGQ